MALTYVPQSYGVLLSVAKVKKKAASEFYHCEARLHKISQLLQ